MVARADAVTGWERARVAHRVAVVVPALRALHTVGWVSKLSFQPTVKRFIVYSCRLRFAKNGEQWIDPSFNRTLAEKVSAKPVNGADLRFLEPAEGAIEPVTLVGSACGCASCLLESFP